MAGSIINHILLSGATLESVWPVKTDRELFAQFPIAREKGALSVSSLEVLIDELRSKNSATHEYDILHFMSTVQLG